MLVAELRPVNAHLTPAPIHITAKEAGNSTRCSAAWLTYDAIRSRLSSGNSTRRQMGHIADLRKFTNLRFGEARGFQGKLVL